MWSITELQRSRKSFSNMKHERVATLSWVLHADKQIISSSFWSQLNMENNLCTHIKKETVSKGMLWKLWEVEVRLAVSEALIHSSWMCGIADVVRDLTLEHDRQVISWLSDEACLACAAYWKPRNSMFPMYGERRGVPILLSLFLTPQKLCKPWCLPYFFLTTHLPHSPCSNRPVCASAADVT